LKNAFLPPVDRIWKKGFLPFFHMADYAFQVLAVSLLRGLPYGGFQERSGGLSPASRSYPQRPFEHKAHGGGIMFVQTAMACFTTCFNKGVEKRYSIPC
jgi:hypothetical protein